jgi:hypothetical protein
MNLEQVIRECDALRKCIEGVGLSDGLISCIELAYNEGRKADSAAVTEDES